MSYASPELCTELLNVSGWEITRFSYKQVPDGEWVAIENTIDSKSRFHRASELPAYDLGYLLRKLPPVIDDGHGGTADLFFMMTNLTEDLEELDHYQYRFKYRGIMGIGHQADTPEDATAKLAIELFKQGILTKPE